MTEPGQGQHEQDPPSWTPPANQEELDRIIQDRVARAEKKYRDYDTIKEKAEQFDVLSAASQSEKEKAVEEARIQAIMEATNAYQPRVVRAEFKLAANEHGLSKDQLESLLEDLDLSKYADDDGEPDTEKIAKKVKAFAPAKEENGNNGQNGNNGRGPNFGQGSGHQPTKGKRGEAGKAEAMRRFPDAFKEKASSS